MGTDTFRFRIAQGLLAVIAFFLVQGVAAAGWFTHTDTGLGDLELEQLMRVKVISASRKPELWFETASAVYVVSGEDIRRSGYNSVAEALRLAPGVQVARLSSHDWAISSRGFNSLFSNKLLVLVDGRSVYSPLDNGVRWDRIDMPLEDIERIEVIRGPGGALWGANAVNGVINIITKSSAHTQGWLLSGGGGTEDRGFGTIRYGGKLGESGYFRLFGKYFDRGPFPMVNGRDGDDSWHFGRGGFRLDWEGSDRDILMVQGEVYSGGKREMISEVSFQPPFRVVRRNEVEQTGGNLLGRWTHIFSADSETETQVYYDRVRRDQLHFDEDIETLDATFQHRFAFGARQEIIWGVGYRLIHADLRNSQNVIFDPEDGTFHLPSIFLQDEIALVPDRLRFTLGTKLEHHYFTGWEVQPNARLLWTPHPRHTAWAAVSRAVRAPALGEREGRFNFAVDPGPPMTAYAAVTDERIQSEELLAYEIGYRVQPLDRLTLDTAAFYNVYENFMTFEPRAPFNETSPPPAHLVVPFDAANKAYGETYGAEFTARWQALDWWRWDGSYSFLQIQMHAPRSNEPTAENAEGESPHHQVVIRSVMDLPRNVELDCVIRYVDSLPNVDVPGYVTLDVRLGWRPTRHVELSLVGQNLLDEGHVEFRTPSTIANTQSGLEVPRGFYAKITCRF